MKKPEVYEALVRFLGMQEAWSEAKEAKSRMEREEQTWVWHIQEVSKYCDLFTALYEALRGREMSSEGMQEFYAYLAKEVESEAFQDMKREADDLFAYVKELHVRLECTGDMIYVSRGQVEGSYQRFLQANFGETNLTMKSPFSGRDDLTNLEGAILEQVAREEKPFFKKAKDLATNLVQNGHAKNKFYAWIKNQGGDIKKLKDKAKKYIVTSPVTGYINNIDAMKLAQLVFDLGAGRVKKTDKIDYASGVVLNHQLGEKVTGEK